MGIDTKTAEEQWSAHRLHCFHCKLYKKGLTATLAKVCVQGAPLIKAVLEKEAAPAIKAKAKADRDIYKYQMAEGGAKRATRDTLKRITRYKE